MNTFTQKVVAAFLVTVMVGTAVPSIALAQSSSYQPQSTRELIAYLMGRIAQLQEMQRILESGSNTRIRNTSVFNYVTVQTQRADNREDVTAVLRGEVHLFGDASATAWFEYGEDEDFLDFRTRKVNIRSAYDRALRTQVSRLEDDEKYYFRIVAEDKNGTLIYGDIFEFRTDESED